jgi:hypothetical protein
VAIRCDVVVMTTINKMIQPNLATIYETREKDKQFYTLGYKVELITKV